MKRICLFLTTLLFLAGCQQQELDVQAPSDTPRDLREVIVTASIADGQQATRTSYDEVEAKNYWTPGDKIKIFSAGYASEFTSINTVPEPIVKFQGMISFITGSSNDTDDTRHYVWGLYPYSEGATYTEPDGASRTARITTTFPSIQVGADGTFGDNLSVMIGRSESLSIPFRGAYSGAFFKVSRNDIESITLRGLNNEVLAGTATLGLNDNLTPVVHSVANPKTSVTVTAPRGTFEPGVNYYLITLPDVALPNGYSVTLRRSDGYEGTYELRANRPLNRIKFRNLSEPVDVRIENPDNIADGISTGWVQSNGPASYEIWYKTSDDSDLSTAYHIDRDTGNEVDIDNSVAPSEANGHVGVIRFTAPITVIDQLAFRNQDKLTSITLPNSVQTIRHRAFSGCEQLSEANLGTGLKRIHDYAFERCGFSIIDFLPEGLQTIESGSFSSCPELISVTIPSTVARIGGDFSSNPSENPFGACGNLSEFSGKFATSDGLALIQTLNSETYFVSFAPGRMTDAVYTVPDDVDILIADSFAGASLKNVIFPEGLREIRQSAFLGCDHLTSLTIPSSVECIDKGAFENCQNLEWIKMNCTAVPETNYNGGTDYGFDVFAFSFCSIYVPANLLNEYKTTSPWSDYEEQGRYMVADREIRFTTDDPIAVNELLAGYKAAGTYGISEYSVEGVPEPGGQVLVLDAYPGEVTFDNDLTEIPDEFFEDMSILSVEILSDQVTRIGSEAFKGTGISEIVLPESVTEIGSGAFSNTASLASFSGGCSLISEDGRCLINSDGKLIAFAGAGLDGSPYSIPAGVTQIVDMNSAPFSTVDMPSTVNYINPNAFKNCANLSEITLSPSVFVMGSGAFEGCSSLSRVILDRTDPPYIIQDVVAGTFGFGDLCNDFFKVYVPVSAFDTYRDMSGWDYIYEKGHLATFRPSQANNEIWYTVTNGFNGANLDFRGIQDAFDEGGQWTSDYDETHEVWVATFSFDLTEIPAEALYMEEHLKTISLPQSVTSIGERAFCACSNLRSIDLPEGLTFLGHEAFGDCENLSSVSLPASYYPQSTVDICPFNGSHSISSFSGDSPSISSDGQCLVDSEGRLFAFASNGLNGAYYTIPDGVVVIGTMNRAGFNSVTFPSSVQIIEQGAFYGCEQLDNLRIGSGVTDIREGAFQNCTSLRVVRIPSNVSFIKNYAFKGCSALQRVWMESATPPQLYPNNQTFGDTNDTFKIVIPSAAYWEYYNATGWSELRSHFDLVQTNREIWCTSVNGEEIDMRGVTGEDIRPFYFENGGFWVAVFENPVTSIPDRAFWKYSDLKTIILPGTVQSIGSQAFDLCSQLESVKLLNPDALTSIGSSAFSTAQKLRVVGGNIEPVDGEYITDLPAVTDLGTDAFYQASKITNLRLPVLETLNKSLYLSGIKSLEIPNVKTLGADAIYGTSSFKVLNLPSVEVMGNGALGTCRYFEEIHIGPNVVNMEAAVFQQDPYVYYPLTGAEHTQQLKLYVEATTPPAVSSETFKLMNDANHGGPVQLQKIYAVYVPAASEAAYEAAWADALSIVLPDGMTVAQVVQPMP